MTKQLRVTGPGIYGAISKAHPTGELPVGYEFHIRGEIPAGWKGRVAELGKEPAEGAELIVNDDDDSDVGKARREVIAKAQEHIDGLKAEHATALKAETDRADKAEGDLKAANEHIDGLKAQIAALEKANEPPALTGKNKAELLEIAAKEGATVEDGATNDDIKAAIELKREADAK